MKVKVTNIQRFCLNDGPGIRTVVFVKGCNLRCPWCANPENISFTNQKYCIQNEKGIYGYDIDIEELKKELLKDRNYYANGGGITFSGGEPLFQIRKMESLLGDLKKNEVNICIETALMVSEDLVSFSLKYIDTYIVDIKILDKEKCKNILHGSVELYYKNINTLFENKKNVIFRIPLAKDLTYSEDNVNLIIQLLEKYKPELVEIFNVHSLANKKYASLKMECPKIAGISDEDLKSLREKIERLRIKVKVCKL